jgi:hypothetical protein
VFQCCSGGTVCTGLRVATKAPTHPTPTPHPLSHISQMQLGRESHHGCLGAVGESSGVEVSCPLTGPSRLAPSERARAALGVRAAPSRRTGARDLKKTMKSHPQRLERRGMAPWGSSVRAIVPVARNRSRRLARTSRCLPPVT